MVRMGSPVRSRRGLHQADDQRKTLVIVRVRACGQAKLAVLACRVVWMGACWMESTSLATIRIVAEPRPVLRPVQWPRESQRMVGGNW